MTKITREQMTIFGAEAGFQQIAQFGSLFAGTPIFTTDIPTIQALPNYGVGWNNAVIGGNSPAIEDMNALHYLFGYQLAYICQAGIPEYNVATTYYTGSLVNNPSFVFTVTSANATVGATYTNNGQTFTVVGTISAGTTLICVATGSPGATGTLTKASGTGDATITFSSWFVKSGEFLSLTDSNVGNSLTNTSFWRFAGNPMISNGDLIVGGTNGLQTRLAHPGASGYFLTTNSTNTIDWTNSLDLGPLIIQTSSATPLTLESTAATQFQLLTRYSADTTGVTNNWQKSRGTTIGSNVAIVTGDTIGSLNFQGYDGVTGYISAASIKASATGTIASGEVPGILAFQTATAAGTLTNAILINSAQQVGFGMTPSTSSQVQVAASVNGISVGTGPTFSGTTLTTGGLTMSETGISLGVASNVAGMTLYGYGSSGYPNYIIGSSTISGGALANSTAGLAIGSYDAQARVSGAWTTLTSMKSEVDPSGAGFGYLSLQTSISSGGVPSELLGISGFQQLVLISGFSSTIANTTTTTVATIRNSSTNTTSNAWQALDLIKGSSTNTAAQIFLEFFISAGSQGSGQITANGSNTAAFGMTSDKRLKTNIIKLSGSLEKILALNPVEFDYIATPEAKVASGHQTGFIAQEIQEHFPEDVAENKYGYLALTGWSKQKAHLVSAIQELHAKLESALARISLLEKNKS